MRKIGLKSCPYCGKSDEIYSSRPKSWRDELCGLLFLQVVRCHGCMRRHYRPLFLPPVSIWEEPDNKKPIQKKPIQAIASDDEKRKQA
jgi:hypothetical protein